MYMRITSAKPKSMFFTTQVRDFHWNSRRQCHRIFVYRTSSIGFLHSRQRSKANSFNQRSDFRLVDVEDKSILLNQEDGQGNAVDLVCYLISLMNDLRSILDWIERSPIWARWFSRKTGQCDDESKSKFQRNPHRVWLSTMSNTSNLLGIDQRVSARISRLACSLLDSCLLLSDDSTGSIKPAFPEN